MADVLQFWTDEERKADRERKQEARKRSKEQRHAQTDEARQDVHEVLRDSRWISVSDIMEVITSELAPAQPEDWHRRAAPAVRRALDELIERVLQRGKNGAWVNMDWRNTVYAPNLT